MKYNEKKAVFAYKGKKDKCMCGCSGKYYYTEENREYAGKKRGYEVDNKEVDNKEVQKVWEEMTREVQHVKTEKQGEMTVYYGDGAKKTYMVSFK